MDVLSFIAIVVFYIWVVIPETAGDPLWNVVFSAAALAVVAVSFWRRRPGRDRLGLRLDNLPRALPAYVGLTLPYAGLVLLWHRDALVGRDLGWADAGQAMGLLFGAFVQEVCLLAFLLNRLQDILGARRPAILAAAGLFAFFHLPNPFLTLYTLGGGLILACLFVRLPNLLAAAVAHAVASALVGGMLPDAITGHMKVGPLYWWTL